MFRPPLTESQKRFRKRAMLVSLGAAAGLFVIGNFFIPLPPLRLLPADDVLCFVAGIAYLQMGLVIGYVHVRQPGDAPMPRARRFQYCASVMLPMPPGLS